MNRRELLKLMLAVPAVPLLKYIPAPPVPAPTVFKTVGWVLPEGFELRKVTSPVWIKSKYLKALIEGDISVVHIASGETYTLIWDLTEERVGGNNEYSVGQWWMRDSYMEETIDV